MLYKASHPFCFLRIAPYIFSPKFIRPRMKAPFRILIFIGMLALPLFVHAELQNGKVEFGLIKGSALLLTPESKKSPAVTGYAFEQGYRVETMKESTTELLLSNGATLILEPGTSLEVRTFRQVGSDLIKPGEYRMLAKEPSPSVTEIVIKRGKVTGEVRKLNPQSTFTIKTPVGVARVRGTIYTLEYAQNNTQGAGNIKVSVVRGLVEVSINGSNGSATSVTAGRQMSAQGPVDVTKNLVQSVKTTVAVAASTQLPKVEGATTVLSVGDEVAGPGIPKGTKVVAVDAEGNVTFSKPVTVTAGTEIEIKPPAEAPPIVPTTVSVTKMNSDQISSVASTLASSSSMSADVVNAVKEIAKTAPPPAPLNVAATTTGVGGATTDAGSGAVTTASGGTTTESASTGTDSGNTETAPTNSGTQTQPSGNTNNQRSVLDKIIDTVHKVIEREQQTNQSPAGG